MIACTDEHWGRNTVLAGNARTYKMFSGTPLNILSSGASKHALFTPIRLSDTILLPITSSRRQQP